MGSIDGPGDLFVCLLVLNPEADNPGATAQRFLSQHL